MISSLGNVNFGNITFNSVSAPILGTGEINIFGNSSNLFSGDIFGDFLNRLLSGNFAFSSNFLNTNNEIHSLNDVYDSGVSGELASVAYERAMQMNTKGYCAKGVNDSIQRAGLANGETRVSSAYMEANVLANHANFKEVEVSRNELGKLPAGCVVVWDKGAGSSSAFAQHGHIAITLGNGREASDNVSELKTFNTNYRVFVPVKKGLNKNA